MKSVSVPFEILISTMFRSDLLFLERMFPNGDYSSYAILIINQTDSGRQIDTTPENVRVINTQERGLPQSRNIGIQNAIGEVCLVADDDVVYVDNLASIILNGYSAYPDAAVITFQLINTKGELYRSYPAISKHTHKHVNTVNGVVISFKKEMLLEKEVFYNLHFGLGATFGTANEYVFMKNVLYAKLPAYFVPEVILTHPDESSGQAISSDRVLYARGALTYKYYGVLSYLWACKYVFFLVRHKYIAPKEAFAKAKKAFSGIKRYKQLLASGEERR